MTRSNFLGSLLHAVEIMDRAKEALRLLDMRATTFKVRSTPIIGIDLTYLPVQIAVRPSGNDFRKATEQDEDVLEQLLRKVTHGDIQNREASVLQAFGLRSFNQRQAKEITLAIQRMRRSKIASAEVLTYISILKHMRMTTVWKENFLQLVSGCSKPNSILEGITNL